MLIDDRARTYDRKNASRVLITFSVPFVSDFYFLRSSIAGGTDFGVWGWCLEDGSVCSKKTCVFRGIYLVTLTNA